MAETKRLCDFHCLSYRFESLYPQPPHGLVVFGELALTPLTDPWPRGLELRRLNNAGGWQVPAPGPSAAPHFGPRSYITPVKALQPLCLNEENSSIASLPQTHRVIPKKYNSVLSVTQIFCGRSIAYLY